MIERAIQSMALAEAGLPLGKDGGMGLALVVLGLLVILFTVMRMRRRKQGSTGSPAAADLHAQAGDAVLGRSSVAEMSELLRSIEEIARETNARLETKIRILEALIREADERIERMKSAPCSESGRALLQGAPVEAPPAGGEGLSPREGSSPPPERRQGELEERFAEVFRLADGGLAAPEIARRTGMLAGEVELVLGLRSRGSRGESRRQPPESS